MRRTDLTFTLNKNKDHMVGNIHYIVNNTEILQKMKNKPRKNNYSMYAYGIAIKNVRIWSPLMKTSASKPFRKIPFRKILFRKIRFRKIPFREIPFSKKSRFAKYYKSVINNLFNLITIAYQPRFITVEKVTNKILEILNIFIRDFTNFFDKFDFIIYSR